MTSKMARLEKESQQATQLATQSWSSSQEKLFSNNFQLFVDMIEFDSSSDICTRCMLGVQKVSVLFLFSLLFFFPKLFTHKTAVFP
jgi:hypothetical protein